MSSRLVTQLVEDQPKVLIIAENSTLVSQLELFFSRQGLDVDLASFSAQSELGLKQILSKNYYKVVVVGRGQELAQVLKTISSPDNLLVINLFSTREKNPFITTFKNTIVGVDVVPERIEEWPLFLEMTEHVKNGFISDPQLDVYLQSQKAFLLAIKPLLLSPGKKRILVRGTTHKSSTIAEEIKRLYGLFFGQELAIKTYPLQAVRFDVNKFEEIEQKAEAIPSLLEGAVREKYSQKNSSDSTDSTDKSIGISVKSDDFKMEKPVFHGETKPNPSHENGVPTDSMVQTSTGSNLKQTLAQPNQSEQVPNLLKKEEGLVQEKSEDSIDLKLNEIFKTQRVDQKVERVEGYVQEKKKITKKTKKKKTLFTLGVVFTFLATVMIAFAGIVVLTTVTLENRLTNAFDHFSQVQAGSEESQEQLENSLSKIKSASTWLERELQIIEPIVPPEFLVETTSLLEISQELVAQNESSISFKQSIKEKVSALLGKDIFVSDDTGQNTAKIAGEYYESTSLLLSRLSDLEASQTNLDKKEKISQFIELVNRQKESLVAYQHLSPLFSSLLGEDGKRTYAIVFQNNHELRPTGGFIQSVALVTIDQGLLVDYQVFSSYDLDKNLGGAVVPPDEIITLLGENQWYLRDSNWDPDFKKSGRQITWFLEQETNRKIDGVFGMNLYVIANLLKEVGPLDLDEYNEVITDKNIFERSEFHSEIKLVDSQDVEDYHTKLLSYLLADVVNKGQEDPSTLLRALAKSVREKQLLVYMTDADEEASFSSLGWSGEVVVPHCPSQLGTNDCQVDFLAINEANIGINKANFHTERRDTHHVLLEESSALHTRTINLKNNALSNAWPKGPYKAYYRFYLPEQVKTATVLIDGQPVNPDSYQISLGDKFNMLGLVVNLPVDSVQKIEISYTMPIETSLPYSYAFFNQKQAGTNDVLDKIEISHAPSLEPTLIAPQAEVVGSSITFDNLKEDHNFVGVSFK